MIFCNLLCALLLAMALLRYMRAEADVGNSVFHPPRYSYRRPVGTVWSDENSRHVFIKRVPAIQQIGSEEASGVPGLIR